MSVGNVPVVEDASLPEVLEPLAEDYRKVLRLKDRLLTETDLALRADLVEALVHICAEMEDAKSQVLPAYFVDKGEPALAGRMTSSARPLGETMRPIYKSVRHTVPLDAHTPDPEGFERDIARFLVQLERHLEFECAELFPRLQALQPDETAGLAEALRSARRHALSHPLPAHGRMLRWLTRLEEHVEGLMDDTSEQYRPAKDLAS